MNNLTLKLGRPVSPNARRIVFPVRLHESEAKLIERAAKLAGLDRTEWMRARLVEAAQKVSHLGVEEA